MAQRSNDQLREAAERQELLLREAKARTERSLVSGVGKRSSSVYRDALRTSGYAVTTDTRRAGAKRFQGGVADRHLTPASQAQLRNICRELSRNNPVGATLVSRVADIVGVQRLQGRSTDKHWNAWLEAKWNAWLDSADVSDRRDGAGVQRWMAMQPIAAGDGAIVFYGDEAGPELAGRIHLVEGELFDAGKQASKYPYGVVRNAYGSLRGVWVRQEDPLTRKQLEPAWVDGANIFMVENAPRATQTRGEPELAASIEVILDLFDLYQTNLDAAKLAATLPVFTTSSSPAGMAKKFLGESRLSGNGTGGTALEPNSAKHVEMPAGVNLVHLGQGDSVEGVKNEYPQVSLVDFGEAMQGISGSVCGIPVHLLTLNLADLSYFGGRMMLHVAALCCTPKRRNLKRGLRWMLERKLAGWAFEYRREKDEKGNARVLPADWRSYTFIDPPTLRMDPLKDTQADVLAINNNLTTRTHACEERGEDFDQVVVRRGEEIRLELEHGCAPVLAPGTAAGNGGATGAPDPSAVDPAVVQEDAADV